MQPPFYALSCPIMNAARAMYPESSMNEMKKYNIMMFGRKLSLPPTPPMIPSTMRSFNGPAGMNSRTRIDNHDTPASIQSIGYEPNSNVTQKMNHIISRNIGNPNSLWVTIVSMMSVVFVRLFLFRESSLSFKAPK